MVVHCVHLIRFDLVLSLVYYLFNHFNICILFSLVYMAVGFFLQNVILVLWLLLLLSFSFNICFTMGNKYINEKRFHFFCFCCRCYEDRTISQIVVQWPDFIEQKQSMALDCSLNIFSSFWSRSQLS